MLPLSCCLHSAALRAVSAKHTDSTRASASQGYGLVGKNCSNSGVMIVATERGARRPVLAHSRDGGRPSWRPVIEDRGRVAVEAFHAIAGANGRVAGENTMRFASEQNELYLEGRRQAYQEVSVAYGQSKPSDDPEVQRAFSQAEELGNLMTLTPGPPSNPNAQASAILGGRFSKYVRANHSLRKS
jgi:hypothetical protein